MLDSGLPAPIIDTTRRALLFGAAAAGVALGTAAAAPEPLPQTVSFDEIARRAPTTGLAPGIDELASGVQSGEGYWERVRSQFNVVEDLVFLNNGTLGPVPRAVQDVQVRWNTELSNDPRSSVRIAEQDVVRGQIARFADVSPDEIALTRGTTEGMNILAQGLDWRAGDEVILDRREHFLIYESYGTLAERFGIQIVWVDVPLQPKSVEDIVALYRRAISRRTRVIVASHVNYGTGLRLPLARLAELAHAHGALLSVDGAQGAGAVPLKFATEGIDHYAAPGHKWLLAGTGCGFSYLRKDLQDRVWPVAGYYDRRARDAGSHTARRYERNGQRHVPSVMGLGEAIRLQEAIGVARIERRIDELATEVRGRLATLPGARLLTPALPELRSGITVVAFDGVPAVELVPRLYANHGVLVRPTDFAGLDAVRVSTHFYNTPRQIEALHRALSAELRAGAG